MTKDYHQLEFPFIAELLGLYEELGDRPFTEWPFSRLLLYEKDLRAEIDYYALYEGWDSLSDRLRQEYEELLTAIGNAAQDNLTYE